MLSHLSYAKPRKPSKDDLKKADMAFSPEMRKSNRYDDVELAREASKLIAHVMHIYMNNKGEKLSNISTIFGFSKDKKISSSNTINFCSRGIPFKFLPDIYNTIYNDDEKDPEMKAFFDDLVPNALKYVNEFIIQKNNPQTKIAANELAGLSESILSKEEEEKTIETLITLSQKMLTHDEIKGLKKDGKSFDKMQKKESEYMQKKKQAQEASKLIASAMHRYLKSVGEELQNISIVFGFSDKKIKGSNPYQFYSRGIPFKFLPNICKTINENPNMKLFFEERELADTLKCIDEFQKIYTERKNKKSNNPQTTQTETPSDNTFGMMVHTFSIEMPKNTMPTPEANKTAAQGAPVFYLGGNQSVLFSNPDKKEISANPYKKLRREQ